MKRILSLLLIAALTVSLAACNPTYDKKTDELQAMDTYMKLEVYHTNALMMTGLRANIESLNDMLDITDGEGDLNEIYRVNQNGGGTVSPLVSELVRQSLALCEETDGALDITVAPLVTEWGFYSKDYHVPDKERIAALLPLVDYHQVNIENDKIRLEQADMMLDFGAVAKGYAADVCLDILRNGGATGAILNLGGTVVAYGEKPEGQLWKVGVADPVNSATYMGYLTCTDKIIATSGSYERYFEGEDGKTYSHILDPQTGFPVDNGILSVTIVSDNGLRSDGLSTALFVMGREKAEEFYHAHKDFDFIILTNDKKAYITQNLAADFTQADGYDYEIVTVQ